jgi:hypothetical protein
MKPIEVVCSYLNAAGLALEAGDHAIGMVALRRLIKSMTAWSGNVYYVPFQLSVPGNFKPLESFPDFIKLIDRRFNTLYLYSRDQAKLSEGIGAKCYRTMQQRETPCPTCACPAGADGPLHDLYMCSAQGRSYMVWVYPILNRLNEWIYSLFFAKIVSKSQEAQWQSNYPQ